MHWLQHCLKPQPIRQRSEKPSTGWIKRTIGETRSNSIGMPAMRIHIHHIASIAITATLIAGCATEPVTTDHLNRVAIITSGNTNFFALTRFGPVISVVEIDGKPIDKPYGPVELEPGTHSVTMKCGDSTRTNTVTVSAGEVYQFAIVTTPGVKGCFGALSRVRSANP